MCKLLVYRLCIIINLWQFAHFQTKSVVSNKFCDNSNTFKQSLLFQTHFSNMMYTLELSFINKCVPKWIAISIWCYLLYDPRHCFMISLLTALLSLHHCLHPVLVNCGNISRLNDVRGISMLSAKSVDVTILLSSS